MIIKIIIILSSLVMLFFILELIRKEKLTFKYAFAWIGVTLLTMFFAVFHQLLFTLAYILGFELPSNFIFFAFSGTFFILSFLMTIFLCQQNNRNDAMAQKIGILEFELNQIKNKIDHEKDGFTKS
ncbi:MAG: DUF2304 domain-containing protein [Candidatus Omnitrophica bacterium]|nr:DUF2304 domain-containing protein [Candidatus Omnitrophota bacterium]